MTSSVEPAPASTPLAAHDISAYTNALAAAIASLGRPDPDGLWALYRIFASLSASPHTRREALWQAFTAAADPESIVLPAASDIRQALAADVLRLLSEPPGNHSRLPSRG